MLPLVFATGAGVNARISIGIAVVSGMLASMGLAVLFVQSFFTLLQRLAEDRGAKAPPVNSEAATPHPSGVHCGCPQHPAAHAVGLQEEDPMKVSSLSAMAAAVVLAACASTQPRTTGGLGAEMPLARPDAAKTAVPASMAENSLVYRSPTLDLSKYHGFYIPSADVYRGADAEFGDTTPQEQDRLAQDLTGDVVAALGRSRNLVSSPGPGIVSLQLTLAGVSKTHPILSLSRLTPVGMGITALKSVEGMPAAFVGSVTIAGKFTDSQTGEILGGIVTRQSPPAYDLRSSAGTMETAQLGLSNFATGLAASIDKMAGPRR